MKSSPPPSIMWPPDLMDELVEEILFRLPPSDPASLVRAALACKRWFRLVSDPGFRRRFRKFHRTPTPSMLGFVYRYERANHFIPTSSFRPPCAKLGFLGHWNWYPIDARHGFFLFFDVLLYGPAKMTFIVLNPITGKEWRLPMPKFKYEFWSAAVLCGTAGCDHLDCPCDAFRVVFVGTRRTNEFTSACVYSSQAGTWSMTASVRHLMDRVMRGRSTFVGNKLYFICRFSNRILEYDLEKQELAVISLPSTCKAWGVSVMTAEEGGLGFAIVQKGKLCIWSREEAGPEGWEQRMVIQLAESLLPDRYLSSSPSVVAFADGAGVVFTYAAYSGGGFAIDLKSGLVQSIGGVAGYGYHCSVLPYMSSYPPVLRATSTGVGSREGPSIA